MNVFAALPFPNCAFPHNVGTTPMHVRHCLYGYTTYAVPAYPQDGRLRPSACPVLPRNHRLGPSPCLGFSGVRQELGSCSPPTPPNALDRLLEFLGADLSKIGTRRGLASDLVLVPGFPGARQQIGRS